MVIELRLYKLKFVPEVLDRVTTSQDTCMLNTIFTDPMKYTVKPVLKATSEQRPPCK